MTDQTFFQTPPTLTNTYLQDRGLRAHLKRLLPEDVLRDIEPELEAMGELAAGPMLPLAEHAEANPPRLIQYGPYGRRVDRIETAESWKEMGRIAAKAGIVAIPHARRHGAASRIHQYALLHLYSPSSATFSCPLAMSDGACAALSRYAADTEFAQRAIAHLTHRDPDLAWTSGQWMTEKEGGSDVGRSSTVARREGDAWRLYGTKYFTSATTSECTLTLARPEGAPSGSRGLSLFYLEPWRADGTSNHVHVRRLKDKLGTKALPTAELELHGTIAHPIGDLDGGLRKIATVLNVARYFNTSAAVSNMARSTMMARAYAQVREAFGHTLIDLPLHAETLANMQVEYEAALAVGVRLAQLLGKVEAGEATDIEKGAWRLLTPLAKLGTGKQCVSVASETLEAFGGAGYVEDTTVPRLLRDAQVLPIWEGTTNVLSLDVLRAMAREHALEPFLADINARLTGCHHSALSRPVQATTAAVNAIARYAADMSRASPLATQLGARGFALSLYRTYAAALLCEAAQWELTHQPSSRLRVAAQRWTTQRLTPLLQPNDERQADNLALL